LIWTCAEKGRFWEKALNCGERAFRKYAVGAATLVWPWEVQARRRRGKIVPVFRHATSRHTLVADEHHSTGAVDTPVDFWPGRNSEIESFES